MGSAGKQHVEGAVILILERAVCSPASWAISEYSAYTQGFLLVYFSSSLSPSYAKMRMNDSPFLFLPVLMDETHIMLSKRKPDSKSPYCIIPFV